MSELPSLYEDRIPAWVKHSLLRAYLEKLVLIIGMAAKAKGRAEICYVDCFAGPWESGDDKLDGTSISISLSILASCKKKLASLGVDATMRALYVELDKGAFHKLKQYLLNDAPDGIETHAFNGDFVDLRSDIVEWVGKDAFCFFLIDPKGWIPISIDLLEPLLRRQRSEFLINFMYEFVNRAASMATQQENVRRLVGRDIDLEGLEPAEREAALLVAYRAGLKEHTPAGLSPFVPRTAYVPVRHPEKQRTKYHLIYLTSHPKGIVEFMAISEAVDVIQARVHVAAEVERRSAAKQSQDMFADHAVAEADDPRSTPAEVDAFWRRYLSNGTRRVNLPAFADILEETNWLPIELQASLLRLIQRREVTNIDAIGKRRPSKPLHFEGSGERLHLQGTAGGLA